MRRVGGYRLQPAVHTEYSRPMARCQICGRELDRREDLLSQDCGGDCWGCIGEIEADGGWVSSLEQVRKEHALGLRPEWVDPVGTQVPPLSE